MIRTVLFFLVFLALRATPGQAQSTAATDVPALPNGRPAHYKTPPKTKNRLFFIQRNLNQNTIVYDAKLNADGSFQSDPIDAYWLRYGSTGERKELTWLQRTFAYGYNAKRDKKNGSYWVTLTAWDGRKIHLHKDSSGKPVATLTIDGKYARLDYIWVYADNSGTWPKVFHVDLHGTDMLTGRPVFERIKN
ncbi:MAG: hypothetical protein CMN32_11515 [Saprospirales bacterium]|nr:hypothetical protein [Saprospirales bacterium]